VNLRVVQTGLVFFFVCWGAVFVWGSGAEPAAYEGGTLQYRLEDRVGGFGSVLGYFNTPRGISGDSQSLYIADSGNNRIVKTDFYFMQWDSFQPISDGGQPLDTPWGIAVEGNAIWVTDSQNHRLLQYSHYGIPQSRVGEFGLFDGFFDTPKSLATGMGCVWVVDSRNHRVQQFHGTVFSRSFGAWGDVQDTLSSPVAVAVLPSREVLVSDDDRLAVFNDLGQWIHDILPSFPDGVSAFGQISGLSVDQDGRIFVADPDHSRVVVLQRDGRILSVFEVSSPADIYAWGALVFVTDSRSHQISRFRRL
jgi:sugar lactone lactonase YvrE